MRIAIRADGNPIVGGGHVMRCLSLALAAKDAGHEVCFLSAGLEGPLRSQVVDAGLAIHDLKAGGQPMRDAIETWRPMPIAEDVAQTVAAMGAVDWVVLDHYGLGGAWVQALRAKRGTLRIASTADLDVEPLFADLLLDYGHVVPRARAYPYLAVMGGAQDALLRPEFAAMRDEALARRGTEAKRVLILPGMMDAAGLAPIALEAVAEVPGLEAEVVMGSGSQSRSDVARIAEGSARLTLTLDATDMAARMTRADICIGAGGGTSWERCCLGLPSILIPVAENQITGVEALHAEGAAIGLGLEALTRSDIIAEALRDLLERHCDVSKAAAKLCDGKGVARVVAAMDSALRPVEEADAKLLFDWRNQAHIRAISLDSEPLVWATHAAYINRIAAGADYGAWYVYSEGGRPLGHVNARRVNGDYWHWSFYKGDPAGPRGAGRRMLVAFQRAMLERSDFAGLTADVVDDNLGSVRLHEELGFRLMGRRDGNVLEFRLDRCDILARFGLPGGN